LLAEELRRLDPDDVYAETLARIDEPELPGVDEDDAEEAAVAAVDEATAEYGN
jgi:hypothetical protein